MITVESLEKFDPSLKILIYGNPGVGKTLLGASMPNPYFISTESGLLTIAGRKDVLKTELKGTQTDKLATIIEIIKALKTKDTRFKDVKTIILDSVTELQSSLLDDQLLSAASSGNRTPYKLYQSDYGENTQMIRRILVNLFELPYHVVVIAHAVPDKDEQGNVVYMRPAITPKVTQIAQALTDVVGYLSVEFKGKEAIRTLQVHPSRRVFAKSRIRGLPQEIEIAEKTPSLQILLDKKEQQANA